MTLPAGIVITFHPDPGFVDRLAALARQVAATYVIDNGSDELELSFVRRATTAYGAVLVENSTNAGIATALNQGMRLARDGGHAWVVTMDQDTLALSTMVGDLTAVRDGAPAPETVAVIGAGYVEGGVTTAPEDDADVVPEWCETHAVITSGCLTSVACWDRLGAFRDDLFIDSVDSEYCLRARRAGLRILNSLRTTMVHRMGNTSRRRVLGHTFTVTDYPPLRHYTIARNLVVLAREYGLSEPYWITRTILGRVRQNLKALITMPSRGAKIAAIVRGLADGLAGRMDRPVPR